MKNEVCNFKCNTTWENITCLDSVKGALYFCIPKDTACAEGNININNWVRHYKLKAFMLAQELSMIFCKLFLGQSRKSLT